MAEGLEPMEIVRKGSRSEGERKWLARGSEMGKHHGSLWCCQEPTGNGDGEETLRQERAGECERVSLGCCRQGGEAVVLLYLHRAHPSHLFLPMAHSAQLTGCLQNTEALAGRKQRQLEQR